MVLPLGNFCLSSYVVLVLSKQKCIALHFKTDTIWIIKVSSPFDSIMVTPPLYNAHSCYREFCIRPM